MSNDVNITLLTHEMHEHYLTKLLGKTLNCTLLDSECTKNVSQEPWLINNYIPTLTKDDLTKVTERESCANFKFCTR